MRKKLNNTRRAIKNLINSSMTTKEDLEKLAKMYGLDVKINWLKDADPKYEGAQIINVGNPVIGGTHWVAAYKGHYFDSFGIVPPVKLEDLEWVPFMIQNPDFGHCGQYCILWLYYMKKNEVDKFYNMFNLDTNPYL